MASVFEVGYAALVRNAAAHATELGQGALRCVWSDDGGVGTWPFENWRVGLNYLLDVVHTGREASTHVDENVGRRANHNIEGWLGLDGRAG